MALLRIKDETGKVIDIPALKGDSGKSAYEYAVDGGYTGTEEDFISEMNSYGELSDKIESLSKTLSLDIPIDLTVVGYVEGTSSKNWHTINTNEGSFNSGYVEILSSYKYIEANVEANEYVFAVIFFDKDKNAIYESSELGDSRTNSYVVEIPVNAAYVIVSSWGSNTRKNACFTNGSLLDDVKNLENRISSLENPSLDKLYDNSEFSLFKQWGIIGDSLSVGHTTNTEGNTSSPNLYYSWGQYLARDIGNTCINFGASGLSAKEWMTDDNGYNLLIQEDNLCQCYILALGANDGDYTLGSISDVDFTNMSNNADTEYGWYAKVIGAIRETAPLAPIFLFTLPYPRNTDVNIKAINEMIRELSTNENFSNIYLVDLDADYNDYFATGKLYNSIGNTGWHLTSLGYLYTAKVNKMAISKVMADNYSDFQNVFEIPYGETEYANSEIGDIETALDSIIAIQNSLIGGEGA